MLFRFLVYVREEEKDAIVHFHTFCFSHVIAFLCVVAGERVGILKTDIVVACVLEVVGGGQVGTQVPVEVAPHGWGEVPPDDPFTHVLLKITVNWSKNTNIRQSTESKIQKIDCQLKQNYAVNWSKSTQLTEAKVQKIHIQLKQKYTVNWSKSTKKPHSTEANMQKIHGQLNQKHKNIQSTDSKI